MLRWKSELDETMMLDTLPTTRMESTLFPLPRALAVLLSVCLPAAAQAGPVFFTSYGDFYRSLGGALFPESGTSLAMPCTESPRHCLWATSMHQALPLYSGAVVAW